MACRSLVTLVAAVAVVALATPVLAQEAPKPEAGKATDAATPRPKKVATLLRAQIVIARYQGERKVASVPYTVLLTADDQKVLLRMGVEVPIAVVSFSRTDDGKSIPSTSFQYRNVSDRDLTFSASRCRRGRATPRRPPSRASGRRPSDRRAPPARCLRR